MDVAQVIRDLDESSGGPSRSLPALSRSLADSVQRHQVSVFYLQENGIVALPQADRLLYERVADIADRLRRSRTEHNLDLVHVHGLWSWGLHRAVRFAHANSIPYVISTRGMLSRWALGHKRWKKTLALSLYQRKDLQQASLIHVTSEQERSDVRRVVGHDRIAVIAHGCDVPPHQPWPQHQPRLAVSICRLHPIKQLDRLIRAWGELRPQNWRLKIVGPDQAGYRDYLCGLVAQCARGSKIEIGRAVDEQAKRQLLAEASLFVLPSASENFGMSIAEALASQTPVLTTTGTPWQHIADRCGWICDGSQEGILGALRAAIHTDAEQLRQMGDNGRKLIEAHYSWASIADQLAAQYMKCKARA